MVMRHKPGPKPGTGGGKREGAGRPPLHYRVILPSADGALLERLAVRHGIDVRQLLLRIAAAEAANPAEADAALAAVLGIQAWEGEIL